MQEERRSLGTGIIQSSMASSVPLADVELSALSGTKLGLLERQLRSAFYRQAYSLNIHRPAAPEATPVSFSQKWTRYFSQMQPDKLDYIRSVALRISGYVKTGTLKRSLTEIARRHEILRATFSLADGGPTHTIAPTGAVNLELVDLIRLPQSQRIPKARRLITQIAQRPLDLERGTLLRATLLQLGGSDHILVAVARHIAFDSRSAAILQWELVVICDAFYTGQPSPLPDLSIQYADFAVWQKERLHQGAFEEDLSYWMKQLAGAPPVTELPADLPRAPERTHRHTSVSLKLPADMAVWLEELDQGQEATPFTSQVERLAQLWHKIREMPPDQEAPSTLDFGQEEAFNG